MEKLGALKVKGNANVQTRLLHYLNGDRIHPALILAGPDRMVKLAVAKNMAKFLLCKRRPQQKNFCDECSDCRRVEKELHPDVLFIREEEEETLKIDTIREVCHQMEISSIEGGAKVCLMDECHRMNAASANAFLKTLEEPGANRYFLLLTTKAGALLPTLVSRCLQFIFKPENEFAVLDSEVEEKCRKLVADLQQKKVREIVVALPEKQDCLNFLIFLQSKMHHQVLHPSGERSFSSSSFQLMEAFDAAVRLEGRLRSNANYGLMLENYLKQYFA